MVVVPASLIISPPTCEADPEIGHVFAESPVFRGSSDKVELQPRAVAASPAEVRAPQVLAVFLMHHMLKGQASFWFPYISMLPKPNTILEWSEPELAELHDRCASCSGRSSCGGGALMTMPLLLHQGAGGQLRIPAAVLAGRL